MHLLLGVATLAAVAIILRRALRLGTAPPSSSQKHGLLSAERESLYRPVTLEVDIRSSVLAIALNDALEEHEAGHDDSAWRLLDLATGEWLGLEKLNAELHGLMARYLPAIESIVPLKHLGERNFRAAVMSDFVRWHGILDQFVFPSRLRFQLHLRVLRHATDVLMEEIRDPWLLPKRNAASFVNAWKHYELMFHDYDLVMKETLLGFRAILFGLAANEIPNIRQDL